MISKANALVVTAALAAMTSSALPAQALADNAPKSDVEGITLTTRASWSENTETARPLTGSELAAMADGAAYRYQAEGNTGVAGTYLAPQVVTAEKLFDGIAEWKPGALLTFKCKNDDYSPYTTYDQVAKNRFFYPNAVWNSESPDLSVAVAAPCGIALGGYWKAELGGVAAGSADIEELGTWNDGNRWMCGLPANAKSLLAGVRMPKDVTGICIVYDNPVAKATGEKMVYDGTAKTGAVTASTSHGELVEGRDFTVSYKDNVEAGTATATVSWAGDYIGPDQEVRFEITKGKRETRTTGLIRAFAAGKSGKLAKKASFKLKTASSDGATASYAKTGGSKKIKVAADGKVTVAKGAKRGTYSAKVTVSCPETRNLESTTATKTVKVSVR